jgi:hypothetical protein
MSDVTLQLSCICGVCYVYLCDVWGKRQTIMIKTTYTNELV